jgi:hypothetical protein
MLGTIGFANAEHKDSMAQVWTKRFRWQSHFVRVPQNQFPRPV